MAPDGNHCETNSKGCGSRGGATAPPLELLPRTTKKSQVGRIPQGPSSTPMIDAKDPTASIWSARMPQLSRTGNSSRSSSGPSTSTKTRDATTAEASTKTIDCRCERPRRVHANLHDADEGNDRRDEHEVEDVDARRVVGLERVGVDDPDRRVDSGDPLEHPGDGRSSRARDVQRRPLRRQIEGRVDVLLVHRVQGVPNRAVGLKVEAPLGHALHRVDRARVGARVADQRGVDAVRRGIAEGERVGRDEERAHDDRDAGNQNRPLDGRPGVLTQAREEPFHATTSTGIPSQANAYTAGASEGGMRTQPWDAG